VKPKTQNGSGARKSEPWHAVAIMSRGGESCAGAILCRSKRFLSGDAPLLPLAECDRPQSCPCTYRHYMDRRAKPRRSGDSGRVIGAPKPVTEKRASRGRRATD
jgi:hypothetical protein